MITVSHRPAIRRQGGWLALTALALAMTVSACSSSPHTAAASTSSPKAESAAQQACDKVDAALSDGPDSDTDPLGYAEAQILPLQQIHTTDQTIGTAITTLASAYSAYYSADGKGAAKSTLNTAINTINKLCPDAGAAA